MGVGKIFSLMFSVVFLFFKINIQLAELCVCVCVHVFILFYWGGFLILIGIEQRKHVRQCQLKHLDIFKCGI